MSLRRECSRLTSRGTTLKALPLSETQFRIAVAVGAAMLAGLMIKVRFCYDPSLPAAPPPPRFSVEDASDVSRRVGQSSDLYANYLRSDSLAQGIQPPTTLDQMSAVFPYQIDNQRRTLSAGGEPITVAGLRLRLTAQRIADERGQQMVLEIENTSQEPLAYRVQTRPSKGTKPCHGKQDMLHNAIVIAPGTSVMRVECLYRDGWELEIDSVETIQLPELAAIYVSWMSPTELGIDARTSRGHRPTGMAKQCDRHHAASIQRSLERGEITWRDLIDFYARHRCTTYSFVSDYKAFTRNKERALPATATSN